MIMRHSQFTVLLTLTLAIAGNIYGQDPRKNINGNFLLKTQWGSDNFHTRFTPGNQPLGCHSIAIAQVLYFHKLAPSGKVNYQCSNGVAIKEDFSDYTVDWNKISARLTESSTTEVLDATAYFNYAVAAIVQKDFATDNYVDIENSDNHKTQIEQHFKCRYNSYVFHDKSTFATVFANNQTFENLIKKEIDKKRPVGFYYIWDDGGHAVVIDGYTIQEGNFYVHANFGWMGHSDGWYLMPADLPATTSLVMLLTIDPLKE
jgi:hypothetical protein